MLLTNFNPYYLLRPLLFRMDAEKAHNLAMLCLKKGLLPRPKIFADPILQTTVCGIAFPNPIGLAAGFDKNIEVVGDVMRFGFGSAELGSITPRPQPGNLQPRLFRVPTVGGIINRFGFNSDGFDVCLRRIIAYRDTMTRNTIQGVIGINIGKNKESTDAAADYVKGIQQFAPYADYLTVNVSSPNTPGLRDLQGRAALADLLRAVMGAQNEAARKPPLFVKIAPDQTGQQMEDIAEVALSSGIDGLIVGNTTLTRPGNIPPELAKEAGGFSGKPLFALSTGILATMYRLTGGKIPLIGVGGVSSGADAYAKIRAGASLVQLYSALVYHGPLLVSRINRDLAALLRRDGFASVADAVGKSKP